MANDLHILGQQCAVLSEAPWNMPLQYIDNTKMKVRRRMQSNFVDLQEQSTEVRRDIPSPSESKRMAGEKMREIVLPDGLNLGLKVLRHSNSELPQKPNVKSTIVDAQITLRRLMHGIVQYWKDNFGDLEKLEEEYFLEHSDRKKSPFHFRWMIRRDIPSVISISQQSQSLTEEEISQIGRRRNHIALVAEIEDEIAGFRIDHMRPHTRDLICSEVDNKYADLGIQIHQLMNFRQRTSFSYRRRARILVEETDTERIRLLAECGYRALGISQDASDTKNHSYLFHYSAPATKEDIAKIRDAVQE